MNPSRLRLLSVLILVAGALPSAPPAARAAGTFQVSEDEAAAFFHVGEAYKINDLYDYFTAYADALDKRFDDYQGIVAKAGAPESVKSEIDRYRKAIEALPWNTNRRDWTPAQRTALENAGQNRQLWMAWMNSVGDEKLFFFWLGVDAMDGWYNIDDGVNKRGESVESANSWAETMLKGFDALLTSNTYRDVRAALNPDVLQTIKDMAALEPKVEKNGLTKEQVNTIGTACRKLRDLSRAGKLLAH